MNTEIEEKLNNMALRMAKEIEANPAYDLSKMLREQLGSLLEAGQAMRNASDHGEFTSGCVVCMAFGTKCKPAIFLDSSHKAYILSKAVKSWHS